MLKLYVFDNDIAIILAIAAIFTSLSIYLTIKERINKKATRKKPKAITQKKQNTEEVLLLL